MSDYRVPVDLLQPHWQLLSWQRHAFFWQPQVQVPHSQVPQQLDFAAFFVVGFFTLDIVFFLFLFFARHALS